MFFDKFVSDGTCLITLCLLLSLHACDVTGAMLPSFFIFSLSIHLFVYRTSRELLLKIVRRKKIQGNVWKVQNTTGRSLAWHSYIPPSFFLKSFFPSAESFQSMNFSEAMFYENYLASDFYTNTVISSLFSYSSKWRQKP